MPTWRRSFRSRRHFCFGAPHVSELASTADLAAEEEDGQLTPPSETTGASGRPSYADDVGRSLLESLGVTEDEPAPEPQPTDDDDDSPPPAAEVTPPAAATLSPEEQMARWVDQLLQNPKDITRIPQKHQAAALEARDARRDAFAAQQIQQAREQGLQAARAEFEAEQQRQQTAAAVAEIDQLKAADRDGYVDWRDQFPDRARAYDDFKEQQRNPRPAAQVDVAALNMQALHQAAEPLRKQLEALPAAKATLTARLTADPTLYGPTPAGMDQFVVDATEAIAEAKAAARMTQEAPARAALEQRQANTEERRRAPRPDVSSGQRAGEPLTDDVDELLAMGLSRGMRERNFVA